MGKESRDLFLRAMRLLASTVCVVTTDGPAGRAGTTVSAMTSVSADPERPILLVCIHKRNSAVEAIKENGIYCVNVLRDGQQGISERFANRRKNSKQDKFAHVEWLGSKSRSPRLVDALVAFHCSISHRLVMGEHHVFFAAVDEVYIGRAGSPLLYRNQGYGAFATYDEQNAGLDLSTALTGTMR